MKKDTFYSQTAKRIKEERQRLKVSQADAALRCACVRETWGKYERGTFDMNTETLKAFGEMGADMMYILTGQRSEGLLSADERRLLDDYRLAPEGVQAGVKTTLEAFSGAGNKKLKKAG